MQQCKWQLKHVNLCTLKAHLRYSSKERYIGHVSSFFDIYPHRSIIVMISIQTTKHSKSELRIGLGIRLSLFLPFFFISYTRSVLMNLIPNLLRALAAQEMMALSNGQRRPLIEIHHLIQLAGLGFAYRESEMRWRLVADGNERNEHRMKTAITACLLACEGLTWVSVFDDLRRAARVSKTKMSQCEYLYFR